MSKKRSFRGAFFMLCKIVSKYPSVFSPFLYRPLESPLTETGCETHTM